jgi:hypothetical protein
MFSDIKSKITELAYSAVSMAEETLSTSSGKDKKTAAIDYIVSMLPIPTIFKSIAIALLSKFIDKAVENAYNYMKNVQNTEA